MGPLISNIKYDIGVFRVQQLGHHTVLTYAATAHPRRRLGRLPSWHDMSVKLVIVVIVAELPLVPRGATAGSKFLDVTMLVVCNTACS